MQLLLYARDRDSLSLQPDLPGFVHEDGGATIVSSLFSFLLFFRRHSQTPLGSRLDLQSAPKREDPLPQKSIR